MYLSIEESTMGLIRTSIAIIWVVILVLSISSIVLYFFNISSCKEVIFPTHDIAQASFTHFQFASYESRYTMEAIVAYKTQASSNTFVRDTKIINMTDYVIYLIATSDILQKDESLLQIYNHPEYAMVMNDYDTSLNSFKNSSSKSIGIDILVNSIQIDKDITREGLTKLSDLQIYTKLLPSKLEEKVSPEPILAPSTAESILAVSSI